MHKLNRLILSFLMTLLLTLIPAAFPGPASAADVTLEWNPVATATGYKLYHRLASDAEYQAPVDVGAETSGTLPDLTGPYFFAVTAYNDYGESGYSTEVFANVIGGPVLIRIIEVFENGTSRETLIPIEDGLD